MCLASSYNLRPTLQNLLKIGYFRQKPRWHDPHATIRRKLNSMEEKLIKKAIYMECSPELANKAIHGFRRSSGDDLSAEEDFLRTNVPYHDLPRDWHYKRALRVTERLFRPSRRLKPIAFPDLRFYPWNLPVSAEYPFTVDKKWSEIIRQRQADGEDIDGRLSFHNLYNEIFDLNRELIHKIKNGDPQFWTKSGEPKPYGFTTLHVRAHLVEALDDDKLRAVFGVPKLLLMAENMFIWNLQREYLNNIGKFPLLWGFETMRGGWQRLLGRLNVPKCNSFLSADWSKFDKFALHEVIDDIHDMWRNWFDFGEGYEPTASESHPEGTRLGYSHSQTKEERIQRLWDWMTFSVKHTPIKGPSGNLYVWQYNGIASGYQQTQLLDSFYNTIMLLTCLSEAGINIEAKWFKLLVQGDDSIVSITEQHQPDLLEKIAESAKRRFNAELSVKKTHYSSDVNDMSVLSYKHRNGIAFREEAELLAHLLYPERGRTLEATASACIGIAFASMGASRPVYNTCKNAFVFLTDVLGRKPDFSWLDKMYSWMDAPQAPLPHHFPTFEETFIQNFDLGGRDEQMKQHLWPTQPTGTYGFYFLNA